MISRISGKHNGLSIKQLNYNNTIMETPQSIANALAKTFEHKSSSRNYKQHFQKIKDKLERTTLNFNSKQPLAYNKDFSLVELRDSLDKSQDTSAGPDQIHYQLLKHLPQESLQILLDIFNHIFATNKFPDSWREATIIPIPKPGKDHTDPANYRPIALTSCVCKTMERMINNRLVWYLEENNILSPYQNGFRQHRSTIDQLVRLETYIREGFIKRQHVVAVFFDLEKAYDTTWKYGIMQDLHRVGLRGNLPLFIQQFLKNRTFKVRLGDTLSSLHDQEQGVPQGSILSPILFNIKLNNIIKSIPTNVEKSLYVDDLAIYFRGRTMSVVERQIQQALKSIECFADENGFRFSIQKTKCVHFCRRPLHPHPSLKLYNNIIDVIPEIKFLGILFDKKLTFKPHIDYLKKKCQKAMNLLRVVSSSAWGADRTTLLMLYKSLIRSRLDYGCVIYGSARPSYLSRLDPIKNQALRSCLGAFRTSPIASLEVESGEPSLTARRARQSILYVTKTKSHCNNPVYTSIFNDQYDIFFNNKPSQIPPLRLRVLHLLKAIGLDMDLIAPIRKPAAPPWLTNRPQVILSLTQLKKSDTNDLKYQSEFGIITSKYPAFNHIYTDGSKCDSRVACAAVSSNYTCCERLPDQASIFTAELRALQLALSIIKKEKFHSYIIFTDSLSSLQALHNLNFNNPLIHSIIHSLDLISNKFNVIFCWIPGHCGIKGNCEADKKAKESSLSLSPLSLYLTHLSHSLSLF